MADLLHHESLAKYTSWQVGGVAKNLYKPRDRQDLIEFLQALPSAEPLLWLVLGSNTLVRDQGFNGTVIITQGGLQCMERIDDLHVHVEAGVSCASMVNCAVQQTVIPHSTSSLP